MCYVIIVNSKSCISHVKFYKQCKDVHIFEETQFATRVFVVKLDRRHGLDILSVSMDFSAFETTFVRAAGS